MKPSVSNNPNGVFQQNLGGPFQGASVPHTPVAGGEMPLAWTAASDELP